jgi:hypothetical protein
MPTKPKVTDVVTDFVTGAPKDAPRGIKAAAWALTIVGILVFLVLMKIESQRYGGDHLALLTGVGIALLGIRVGVVAKWQH